MKKRILILCTGNSARSQMAEGILKSLNDPELEVYSAGTSPAPSVHPLAIRVMKEIGIDISSHKPKGVEQFLFDSFDYVITVCDSARETCPVFTGEVKNRLHMGFKDPAGVVGSEEERIAVFRKIRDEIKNAFSDWYFKELARK
jgi:arsenate reductase